MPEYCGGCGHTRAQHIRNTAACLISGCLCLEWHQPQVAEPTPELTLVGHIESILDSVQEAKSYLVASDTPTSGYPVISVRFLTEWFSRGDHQPVDLILQEFYRQRLVWGENHDMDHSPNDWAAIMTKYVGRYVDHAGKPAGRSPSRDELIKIAAVALSAWITHQTSGRP